MCVFVGVCFFCKPIRGLGPQWLWPTHPDMPEILWHTLKIPRSFPFFCGHFFPLNVPPMKTTPAENDIFSRMYTVHWQKSHTQTESLEVHFKPWPYSQIIVEIFPSVLHTQQGQCTAMGTRSNHSTIFASVCACLFVCTQDCLFRLQSHSGCYFVSVISCFWQYKDTHIHTHSFTGPHSFRCYSWTGFCWWLLFSSLLLSCFFVDTHTLWSLDGAPDTRLDSLQLSNSLCWAYWLLCFFIHVYSVKFLIDDGTLFTIDC